MLGVELPTLCTVSLIVWLDSIAQQGGVRPLYLEGDNLLAAGKQI